MRIYAVTHTLPLITRCTRVCTCRQSPTATPPQECVIVVHTIPGAQTSLCSPTSTPTRRHVESPRSPPQPPPQMAPGTQEPLLLASPGTSLPLTRSLGGWASTAKVDRRWHWQRVWAACVSSVWQLSVSQSPELASLGSRERGNEPQPGSAVPPPVPAAAQEEVRPRARPHPRGRQPEPRGLPLIP